MLKRSLCSECISQQLSYHYWCLNSTNFENCLRIALSCICAFLDFAKWWLSAEESNMCWFNMLKIPLWTHTGKTVAMIAFETPKVVECHHSNLAFLLWTSLFPHRFSEIEVKAVWDLGSLSMWQKNQEFSLWSLSKLLCTPCNETFSLRSYHIASIVWYCSLFVFRQFHDIRNISIVMIPTFWLSQLHVVSACNGHIWYASGWRVGLALILNTSKFLFRLVQYSCHVPPLILCRIKSCLYAAMNWQVVGLLFQPPKALTAEKNDSKWSWLILYVRRYLRAFPRCGHYI